MQGQQQKQISGRNGRAEQKKMRNRRPAHFLRKQKRWLLLRRALGGGVRGAGEDGVVGVGAGEQDGEADGGEHEEDGRVGGQLGEEVGCATGSEGGLRSLAAEGSGEVGGLALLEQDDTDEEERDDNVQDNEKDDHRE